MTADRLSDEKCEACEGGTAPLERSDAEHLKEQLDAEWAIAGSGREIHRSFKFKNFYHTIEFVNAVAWIANRENHHPDLDVSYNRCQVRFSTHAIGGLSRNDFICASKVDELLR